MRIAIRGSELIGTKLANRLREQGHEVVAASGSSFENSTVEALVHTFAGVRVVVDVANTPSFKENVTLESFETPDASILAAEAAAGVEHHVALSMVGIERQPENDYFREKKAQESLIRASHIPYTIIRSTHFFESAGCIAKSGAVGDHVRLSPALFQPISSDDVADVIAEISTGVPLNGTVEIAGPERVPIDEFVGRYLQATKDTRTVVPDVHARFFGAELNDLFLTPGDSPRIGSTRFEDWLNDAVFQTNEHSKT